MDGCCQVHKRNGLTTAGLLFQLSHCRLLWAVIDDTVDHAVIIFHCHFHISQRIFRQETWHLGETNTVAVMIGYLTILLDGNDVTYTHRRAVKIHRFLQIELLIQPFQLLHCTARTVQRGCVDKVIVAPLYGQIVRLQPIQIHKTHILRIVLAHLIYSKTVSLMGKKCLFSFQLPILSFQNFFVKLRALLPFLAGHSKDTVMGIQVSGMKGHFRVFTLLDDINGQFSLHKLIGSLFGEGQQIAVQVATPLQIVLGQHRVRHGILIQCLLLGIRQLCGGSFCGLLADLFLHLLVGSVLQSLDHGKRSVLDGFVSHAQILADVADRCGTAHVRPIQLAAVQLLHSCCIV